MMQKFRLVIPTACLALLFMAALQVPALALEPVPETERNDKFRIIYRYEYLEEDETSRSGLVVVAVMNRSGQMAREVTARIPAFTASPIGHLPIFVGDVADGQMKEVVVPFTAFKNEIVENVEGNTSWSLEFIDPADLPVSVELFGEMSL